MHAGRLPTATKALRTSAAHGAMDASTRNRPASTQESRHEGRAESACAACNGCTTAARPASSRDPTRRPRCLNVQRHLYTSRSRPSPLSTCSPLALFLPKASCSSLRPPCSLLSVLTQRPVAHLHPPSPLLCVLAPPSSPSSLLAFRPSSWSLAAVRLLLLRLRRWLRTSAHPVAATASRVGASSLLALGAAPSPPRSAPPSFLTPLAVRLPPPSLCAPPSTAPPSPMPSHPLRRSDSAARPPRPPPPPPRPPPPPTAVLAADAAAITATGRAAGPIAAGVDDEALLTPWSSDCSCEETEVWQLRTRERAARCRELLEQRAC